MGSRWRCLTPASNPAARSPHAVIPAIANGELMPLRDWLRENVHRHGAKFSTSELLDRVVGGPIAVGPFVSYLKAKLSDVYGVAL